MSGGVNSAGNITDPAEWLDSNPGAPQWLREMIAGIDVKVTKTRDGEGWRRVIAGKGKKHQARLILDDRNGEICLLDNWITPEKVPNLIAALRAAVAEIVDQ